MTRFALALAFTLIAASANAQRDPRTDPANMPPQPVLQHSVGLGGSTRAVEYWSIGARAPEFELPNAAGVSFHLHESRGRWVALFFTDRRDELTHIADLARTLDSLHVRTLAVCHERVRALAVWSVTPQAPGMMALADERGDIASLYGLWDNVSGTARSGLLLLDPQGIVRVALLGQNVSAPSLPGLVQTAVEGL